MGLATAIVGSALLGAGSSIYGAKKANEAAERNQALSREQIEAANRAAYHELPQAFDDRMTGADIFTTGLERGQGAWWDRMDPVAGQAQYGLNALRGIDPYYGGRTQYYGDTQIGGHWDDLKSQNFLQSPDYQFRLNEGLDAVQGSAAAGGGLYSGNTLRDITDYASNLAAGEYGNWFGRQMGIADRDYGADTANYMRDYDQFQGNFARDYGVFGDDYNRDVGRWQYLTDMGVNALNQGAGIDYGTETGAGQAYADVYGQSAQDRLNAGNTVASNWMQGAGYAQNQPYVSPYAGVNNALQSGIQNYMWYDAYGRQPYRGNQFGQTPTGGGWVDPWGRG